VYTDASQLPQQGDAGGFNARRHRRRLDDTAAPQISHGDNDVARTSWRNSRCLGYIHTADDYIYGGCATTQLSLHGVREALLTSIKNFSAHKMPSDNGQLSR